MFDVLVTNTNCITLHKPWKYSGSNLFTSTASRREAHARAVTRFAQWCDEREVQLEQFTPFIVAAYIEELSQQVSKPMVKQHLAAIRMLFDYLATGQIIPANPQYSRRLGRYWIASAICAGSMRSLSVRSAMVRASLRIR
ncbi:MAG: site-specific integrase [Chloroflexi bacterium]|nr:site-specific integrase [Chloroflexota bacterium]